MDSNVIERLAHGKLNGQASYTLDVTTKGGAPVLMGT
jgi:hypothetical protein